MKKLYYTKITFETICKNNSWKNGGSASTVISNSPDGRPHKMTVHQFGKTREDAEEKLMNFLTHHDGSAEIECIDKFK